MSNHKLIRVGFIGAGWSERVQIPMFRLGGLTVQAITSGNPDNAQRAAKNLEIPEVYSTWQELVASPTVDVISIVAPPHLHRAIAVAALQAGKHVICEKPTALNVAEAEAMLAAAQAAPNQLAIIDHELRFHPQRVYLRRLVKEGYIGSVLLVNISVLSGSRLNPATHWHWWSDAERGVACWARWAATCWISAAGWLAASMRLPRSCKPAISTVQTQSRGTNTK